MSPHKTWTLSIKPLWSSLEIKKLTPICRGQRNYLSVRLNLALTPLLPQLERLTTWCKFPRSNSLIFCRSPHHTSSPIRGIDVDRFGHLDTEQADVKPSAYQFGRANQSKAIRRTRNSIPCSSLCRQTLRRPSSLFLPKNGPHGSRPQANVRA